jgi:hypothetical protein
LHYLVVIRKPVAHNGNVSIADWTERPYLFRLVRNKTVPDERVISGNPPKTAPSKDHAELPSGAEVAGVGEALDRVKEAVTDLREGGLQESVEAAIEAIDSSRPTLGEAEADQLAAVADVLEEALDELEKGKVANLLPVIEQAQSIIQTTSVEP